ncbi:hypothetical protein PENTCL1PPCAC_29515 [Pristionchus entomophagus]|uniref:BZIP domain-containing protein n=1 Tax=Pristionchus entomophagus TaxID=358040 RepID=A0AAV5ULP1_9BILA|nr:hypothetical protein PENTCL1PPCAC_29515 [Pristionchus entomophagus]
MDQFDLDPHYFVSDPFMSGESDPHIGNMIDSYIINYDQQALDEDFPMFTNDLLPEDMFADDIMNKLDEQEAEQANTYTTMNAEHAYAATSSRDGYDDILNAAVDASGIYPYESFEPAFDHTPAIPIHPTQQKQTIVAPTPYRAQSNIGNSLGGKTIVKAPIMKSQSGARNGNVRFNRLTPPSSFSLSSSSPSSSPSPSPASSPIRRTSTVRSSLGERSRKYSPLNLTDEEKRVAKQMNCVFPDYEPLTRQEKSNLAKVRRKIRNKISAQNSRRRKQDYVEELERELDIVKQDLREEIEMREREKSSMMGQIRKLQAALAQSSKRGKQAGTCFAVLILSACLLVAPNISPLIYKNIPSGDEDMLQERVEAINDVLPGRSRTLMEYSPSSPLMVEAPFQCPPPSLAAYGQEAEVYDSRCQLPSKKTRSLLSKGARFVNNQYQRRVPYNNNVVNSSKKEWVYPSQQPIDHYDVKYSPSSSSSASSPEYNSATSDDGYGVGGGVYRPGTAPANRTKKPEVRTQHIYRTMYNAEPI